MKTDFVISYWAVAFLDLLGQKDAFLKTDYIPKPDDAEARERFSLEVAISGSDA